MMLGIFQDERVYEGNANFLNALYPLPIISKVVLGHTGPAELGVLGNLSSATPALFREDSFDPTTRLRRGRFYIFSSRKTYTPPQVNHYPYAAPTGSVSSFYDMNTYTSLQPSNAVLGSAQPLIFLGDDSYKTAWRIIGTERMFNSETLFTLKSANALGSLPDLIPNALPADRRLQIEQGFEKTVDAARKYLPESVVDVCREFARIMLAAWLLTAGRDSKGDLGDLIKAVPDERLLVKSAASIINRLHPRGKSSEQERRAEQGLELRLVSHEDGELAVGLVACLLQEFGWAV